MKNDLMWRSFFCPLKQFAQQYSIEERFLNRWAIPVVDLSISYINKTLAAPHPSYDNHTFKDPINKRLEALLKTIFTVAAPAMQPTIVSLALYQTIAAWF